MKVLAIAGGTCSGKSTLLKTLVDSGFAQLISHTTRSPRKGEINGVDYNFVLVDEFSELQEKGEFIEVNEFCGAKYGKTVGALTEASAKSDCIVAILEPNGVKNMARYCSEASIPLYAVWLHTSREEQMLRLASRSPQMTAQELSARMDAIKSVESGWAAQMTDSGVRFMSLSSEADSTQTIANVTRWFMGLPYEELDSHGS